MKKILLLLGLVLAFASCEKKETSTSLEGRWNVYKTDKAYSFSLIFKGNQLDVYIIAWGEHVVGTYTYADDVVKYKISKVYKAWETNGNIERDKNGDTITGAWDAYQGMNQETFELNPIYSWYPLSKDSSHYPGDMLEEFEFKLTSDTTAETDLLGEQAHKAK